MYPNVSSFFLVLNFHNVQTDEMSKMNYSLHGLQLILGTLENKIDGFVN